jgi:hypothetical protein
LRMGFLGERRMVCGTAWARERRLYWMRKRLR